MIAQISVHAPKDLVKFCDNCSQFLQGARDHDTCIEYAKEKLPILLNNKVLFKALLEDISKGGDYPDTRRPTMFDNEVLLHTDSQRLFSLRIYLWGPGEYTPIHDHNSWGVIGTVSGAYEVINYRRDDDGSREGYARLTERERIVLRPGEVSYTLPFNDGIHQTGNPTTDTVVTLSMYGSPQGRGFLNGFDLDAKRVYKILPPRLKKRFLAAEALTCFP